MKLKTEAIWWALSAMMCFAGCSESPSRSVDGTNALAGNTSSTLIDNRTADGRKILRLPIASAGPQTMDPAQVSRADEKCCVAQIYETLVQYKYLKRPLELEPLLLESMPEVGDDGKNFTFRLKKGVHFHDDPCFPGGTGRELVTDDVFFSWKRLADPRVSAANEWLLENNIVGLDEYRDLHLEELRANSNAVFNYDADIEGMQKISEYEFRIVLKKAHPRFYWMLAMPQLSIVPREAVEAYGDDFALHPVGTGPYTLHENDWLRNKNMIMNRNSKYHEESFPDEFMPSDKSSGLATSVGRKLPLVDRIETIFYTENQPMWMEFRSRKLGFTTVPGKIYFQEAFDADEKTLKPGFVKEGVTSQTVQLLDFIFYGFNMQDPLVGGYTDDKRYLRQAIALAIDWEERNQVFYDGLCTIYDGMIPPGLDGYPAEGRIQGSYRGPDLERARELLSKAGFPDGKGLPAIRYHMSLADPGPKMVEMTAKHLADIGVKIKPQLDDFEVFMEAVDNKNAMMFYFSWISDYPDSENNLALFYGPHEAPGNNYFNYRNDDFDRLYEQSLNMQPGPERTAIYEELRNIVIRDCPYIGSLGRVRHYLVNPELKNFKATEDFHNWYKYLDVK